MQVICKYYTTLYRGLECSRISVSTGVLEPMPWGYQGLVVLTQHSVVTSMAAVIKFWLLSILVSDSSPHEMANSSHSSHHHPEHLTS